MGGSKSTTVFLRITTIMCQLAIDNNVELWLGSYRMHNRGRYRGGS